MNKAARFLIAVAIVGLGLLVWRLGEILAARGSTVPGLRPSPTPEVLGNGWYRFTDTDAGYSISYLPSALLDAQNQAGLEFRKATILFPSSVGEELQAMEILVYSNRERSSLPDLIRKKIYHGRLPRNINTVALTPVKIAGLDAAKLEMVHFYPGMLFSAKGRIYFVALPMNMMWGNPPTAASVDLFYQIIETFSLN